MTGDRRKAPSDAELRDAVLAGWHRLGTNVKAGGDQLGTLAKLTGMPFRQLDMVRQVRNRIAHPDGPIPRDRLLAALRIIADAELRLAAKKQNRPRKQQPGKGRGPARRKPAPKRPPRGKRKKAKAIRRRGTLVAAAIVTFVVAAGVVVFVLLQS